MKNSLFKKSGYSLGPTKQYNHMNYVAIEDYMKVIKIPKDILRWRDAPTTHPNSQDTIEWYREGLQAAIHGVTHRGYFYNPLVIWWLNFFVFPVPIRNKAGEYTSDFETSHPFFNNMDLYILNVTWAAMKERKHVALIGGRGLGKDQSVSTLTPTPVGNRKFGDLKVGDEVYTGNGDVTIVKGIKEYSPKDMYDVTFGDRRKTNCGTGHLWNVYQHNRKGIQTVEAIEIAENLKYGKPGKEGFTYFIPIAGQVEFPEKEQPIDPYMMGYLLGDGSYTSGGCCVATDDCDVIERFSDILGEDYKLTPDPSNNNYYIKYLGDSRKINKRGYNNKVNPFTDKLRNSGLFGKNTWTKRILDCYKKGSVEQRMSLVQGMMDSDGYAYKERSSCEYYSVNKGLIDDLAWVVRSLGIKCTLGDDIREDEQKGYRLFIYTGRDIFKIPRKLKRLKKDNEVSSKILNFRYRTSITNMELYKSEEPSRCIEVSDPSHTYLTNDFIVTHNSYLWTSILTWKYILFPESSVIVSATSSHHTDEAWSKVQDCLGAFERNHPMLAHKRLKDSNKLIESGEDYFVDGIKQTRGYQSKIEKIIYGDNPGATRGRRPDIQLVEEFAAFPSTGPGRLENCIAQSIGSWKVMGGLNKCTVLYSGTGGTVNNDDAKNLFMDPKGYEVFPIFGWNGERGTGLFIPTHYKWAGTWEKDGNADIKTAELAVDKMRYDQRDNPSKLTKFCQEFPKTLKEVFTKTGTNNFNQAKLAEQFVRFDFDENVKGASHNARLEWIKSRDGRITGVAKFKDESGPFEILEDPMFDDDGNPYKKLYVGGVDSIDQGNLDSTSKNGSKLALLIKKRIPDGSYFKSTQNIYVCKYVKRSDDPREDYENVLKATVWYNASLNVEYTKIGIISYFRDQKQYHRLMKRPTIALANKNGDKFSNTNSNLIGTQATPNVIDHQDTKIAEYIEDYCHDIYFQDVVSQLIDYKREDRTEYDLVIAMGLAELADEEYLGVLAKPSISETKDFKSFGYYYDANGYKKFGIIPDKDDEEDFQQGQRSGIDDTITWVDKDGQLKFDDYYGY